MLVSGGLHGMISIMRRSRHLLLMLMLILRLVLLIRLLLLLML